MGERTLAAQRAAVSSGVGHSHLVDSEAAGREAVRTALEGHVPTADDLVILFTSVDHDVEALYAAAVAEAAPAGVFGCTSTGGFTHTDRFRAAASPRSSRPTSAPSASATSSATTPTSPGPTRRAAETARERAGDRYPQLGPAAADDGLTPDQREVARGAYEVTTAVDPVRRRRRRATT